MGEESKIPVPSKGGSLFERADGAFDLGGAFKPAAVPQFAPKPAVQPKVEAPVAAPAPEPMAAPEPVPVPEAVEAPAPVEAAHPEPVPAPPAPVAEPAPPVQPVRFAGAHHPVDRAVLPKLVLAKHLERNGAALEHVRRPIDPAHPARAQEAVDAVGAHQRPGPERSFTVIRMALRGNSDHGWAEL